MNAIAIIAVIYSLGLGLTLFSIEDKRQLDVNLVLNSENIILFSSIKIGKFMAQIMTLYPYGSITNWWNSNVSPLIDYYFELGGC